MPLGNVLRLVCFETSRHLLRVKKTPCRGLRDRQMTDCALISIHALHAESDND